MPSLAGAAIITASASSTASMLKDNHLAVAGAIGGNRLSETVALAVNTCEDIPVEVEVDTLEQIAPRLEGRRRHYTTR
jgi:nicotinate-nucleotide pyrophosphorylase